MSADDNLVPSIRNCGCVALAFVTFAFVAGCDQLVGPANYDDCILKNMRGTTNSSAAADIRDACQAKFPGIASNQIAPHELNLQETSAITGRGRPAYENTFKGNLYNGNKDIAVTEVQIQVTTTEAGNKVARAYAIKITIPPQTAKDITFEFIVGDKGSDTSWIITAAKGL